MGWSLQGKGNRYEFRVLVGSPGEVPAYVRVSHQKIQKTIRNTSNISQKMEPRLEENNGRLGTGQKNNYVRPIFLTVSGWGEGAGVVETFFNRF